jgi:hypothetical protein
MKKKAAGPTLRPEDILHEHNPEVRWLSEQLRQVVLTTVPEATEIAYPVWHGIGYRHPQVGYFCAIFPQKDQVNLSFEFGVLLPDPHLLLKGNGTQVRFVPIFSQVDLHTEALSTLIRAAISLPADRTTRLALVKAAARVVKDD